MLPFGKFSIEKSDDFGKSGKKIINLFIQTLGLRNLSGCFSVHICVFYSSYSSHFAFCIPRPKFLEPKWSQPVKSIINYSLIVIENILLATALYDSTKLFLNFSTSSLLSAAQNSNNFVESKIA